MGATTIPEFEQHPQVEERSARSTENLEPKRQVAKDFEMYVDYGNEITGAHTYLTNGARAEIEPLVLPNWIDHLNWRDQKKMLVEQVF